MSSNEPDDALSRTLASWRVKPPARPDFRAAVWTRIERGRANLSWLGYVREHVPAIGGALALALVVGAFGGAATARARIEAHSAQLATAYVQSLDARAMRMP
jgi:hypothetical protein